MLTMPVSINRRSTNLKQVCQRTRLCNRLGWLIKLTRSSLSKRAG
ncbi:hypothetical protein RSAG8_04076, partial [Rhizoctonia solani AG-8 WAC10335]